MEWTCFGVVTDEVWQVIYTLSNQVKEALNKLMWEEIKLENNKNI